MGYPNLDGFLHPSPYVCVHALSWVQLLVTPRTIAHQAPLSMGFSRQERWNELPFPSPGDLSSPGIDPCLLHLLHWQGGSFHVEQGSPTLQHKTFNSCPVGLTTNSALLTAECRSREASNSLVSNPNDALTSVQNRFALFFAR